MNTEPHPYLAEQVSWSASAGTGNDFKYTHYKVWDEITYPFPNFNGFTVEVW